MLYFLVQAWSFHTFCCYVSPVRAHVKSILFSKLYTFNITLFLSVGVSIFVVSFVLEIRKPSRLPAYLY